MNWTQLNSIDQLEQISDQSFEIPVVIFKHSTSCGLSSMVLRKLEESITDGHKQDYQFYFVDLHSYREVSNAVAEKWAVEHESPQMLLIKSNELVLSESHFSIEAELLDSNH